MKENRYKIIFMGTPDFAVPGLNALANDARFEIISVITQADKPIGRKQEISQPAVKKAALKLNLPILQPRKVRDIADDLKKLEPDFIVVIAYGQILNEAILNIPKIACINIHGSLLPKYRGAACLQAPILNGDSETGITIMLMEKGLDTGDILRQEKITLNGDEGLEFIHDTLSNLGAKILGDTLNDFAEKKIKPQKQDEAQSSYIKQIKKTDGEINWHKSAIEIERQIRAFTPWPGAFTSLDGKSLKIIKAEILSEISEFTNKDSQNLKIGQVFKSDGKLAVKCGQNYLLILELQLEGKRAMSAEDFLAGHKDVIGKTFLVPSSNG